MNKHFDHINLKMGVAEETMLRKMQGNGGETRYHLGFPSLLGTGYKDLLNVFSECKNS